MSESKQWGIHNNYGKWWHTDIGWVSIASLATKYSHERKGYVVLPLGGRWKDLTDATQTTGTAALGSS